MGIPHKNYKQILLQVIQLLGILCLFFVSLNLMSATFLMLGSGFATKLISISSNPFLGLFIGMLATAVIQSSSTSTTLIVTMVATGSISLTGAVPLIMGANIGTSVTSTIVALGHIGNKNEYRKAIGAASVHDFFNIITVVVLFTVEITTHAFSGASAWLAEVIGPYEGENTGSIIFFVKIIADWIITLAGNNPYITLPFGIMLLFISLQLLTQTLKTLVIGKIQQRLNTYIFGSPLKSLVTGFITTAAVQSSSVTSSLMVPLVAANKVSLTKAFPFLMGANIGTTTTALIAALFLGGPMGKAALAIAFAHLLFNFFGVCILFPIKSIREIPIKLARRLGYLTLQNRLYGLAYVLLLFFILPFSLIFFFQG